MKKQDLIKFLECFSDEIDIEIHPQFTILKDGTGCIKNNLVNKLHLGDVMIMLPSNKTPEQLATEFTDKSLRHVRGMVGKDYENGYLDGTQHFIEYLSN